MVIKMSNALLLPDSHRIEFMELAGYSAAIEQMPGARTTSP